MIRVKICGITNARDARMAARLGADALGFNFYRHGPRCTTKERARAIVASLPPFVTPVGVFVNEDADTVMETCDFCGISVVQLHGDEPPRYLDRLSRFIRIKAFRIREEHDLRVLERYRAEALLLDAHVPGKFGGTGETFRWELAQEGARFGPIILAGGLTPENVAEAVTTARPYAVDVASGVESSPGRKDRALLTAFIRNAVNAALEL